jgi:hypothetical protein
MATDMIDTIHKTVSHVPASAPKVAGYVTGYADIMWTAADWARFSGGKVHINQSGRVGLGQVLDVEFRAATNADAVAWGRYRQASGKRACFYISEGSLAGLVAVLHAGGVDVSPKGSAFWVANWDLSRDQAVAALGTRAMASGHTIEVVAVQWASPSSNPHTNLPGTPLTLAEANCDLSVTRDGWYATAPPPVPPGPERTGYLVPVDPPGVPFKLVCTDGKNWS